MSQIACVLMCLITVMLPSCQSASYQHTSTSMPDTLSITATESPRSSPRPTPISTLLVNTLPAPTPRPTRTPTPRPTQIATLELDLERGTSLISSDLLYLSEGKLLHWNPALGRSTTVIDRTITNQSTVPVTSQDTLLGRIVRYLTDERLGKIALLLAKGISANAIELFDFGIYDVTSGEMITLLAETPRLFHIALSPDGEWVIYTTRENDGRIYAVRTNGSGQTSEIGNFESENIRDCCEIAWSPDSKYVIWSDARGVWITNPEDPHVRRILLDTLEVTDFGGDKATIRVMYTSLSWSPSGRYVLSTIQPFLSSVRWQGIIDTRRGRIVEVPETFEYRYPVASSVWMRNGDLLVAYGNDEDGQLPALKIWRMVPTRDDLITLEADNILHLEEFSDPQPQFGDKQNYSVSLPAQIDHRWLSFIVNSSDRDLHPTLFMFDMEYGSILGIGEIPSDTVSVRWSSDGIGAILLGQHGSELYISIEYKRLIDLRSAFGDDTCCFTWSYPGMAYSLEEAVSD